MKNDVAHLVLESRITASTGISGHILTPPAMATASLTTHRDKKSSGKKKPTRHDAMDKHAGHTSCLVGYLYVRQLQHMSALPFFYGRLKCVSYTWCRPIDRSIVVCVCFVMF